MRTFFVRYMWNIEEPLVRAVFVRLYGAFYLMMRVLADLLLIYLLLCCASCVCCVFDVVVAVAVAWRDRWLSGHCSCGITSIWSPRAASAGDTRTQYCLSSMVRLLFTLLQYFYILHYEQYNSALMMTPPVISCKTIVYTSNDIIGIIYYEQYASALTLTLPVIYDEIMVYTVNSVLVQCFSVHCSGVLIVSISSSMC